MGARLERDRPLAGGRPKDCGRCDILRDQAPLGGRRRPGHVRPDRPLLAVDRDHQHEGGALPRALPAPIARSHDRRGPREDQGPLQHGLDPAVHNKPIATVANLRDEPSGATYEARLFDAPYVETTCSPASRQAASGPGTFRVLKDELRQRPARSDFNPHALPEVSIVEARVREISAVTFPAYDGATASMRSASGGAVGEVSLITLTRAAAYGLGKGERWATRAKPGEPGVIQRERVLEGEPPSWEASSTDDPYWLLRR